LASNGGFMTGKVVLVTGATGGLGTAVTKVFLDAGAITVGVAPHVRASDFNHPAFKPVPADITMAQGAQDVVEEVLRHLGHIDVLAHLVGGFAGGQPVDKMDDQTWKRMMSLNLDAAFFMTRAVLAPMQRAGSGRIIAIASRAALDPGANVGAYSASKAAMVSLIQTIAIENKNRGITANSILPATIDTPANRKLDPGADYSQWIRPEAIASMILWLATDAGAVVTGAAIPMYGAQL